MPIETVTIRPRFHTATFLSGQRVVIEKGSVHVVVRGVQGPPGPAGESADASFEWTTQAFALEAPQQEFVLEFGPRQGSISVYLNGLWERFWSIADLTVTLEDSALEGDTVVVRYQKEV